ncbi:hypothetical protein GCM10009087_10640 [Sphingomonas oligophenolica]|uniref:DUF2868 domain-containing protein n=1 Tax=Sphingomonas oligophenolica TaxID=301154 RepID=A0ABU9Y9T9_9SPHN
MDMIETYLDAVAAQLPRDTRDDIIAELRDTLLSQIEEREAALGRPLDDDEREAILRAMGHPLVVGARYRAGPQMLIGPELFPYWLFAVKVGLAILALVFVVTSVIGMLVGSWHLFGQAFPSFIGSGLTVIGAVTVTGAAIEHFGLRPAYFDSWRVKDLAVLRFSDPATWAAEVAGSGMFSGPRARRTRFEQRRRMWPGFEALAGVVWGLVFVAWWIGLLHFPGQAMFGFHGADVTAAPAPIWTTLFVPILAFALVQVAVDAVGVAWPRAVRVRAALGIPVALAGAALAWVAFLASEWIELSRSGDHAMVAGGMEMLNLHALEQMGHGDTLAGLAAILSVVFSWMLAGIAVGQILKALKCLWRLCFG